jgi:CheY-like chemotaxis protein
MAPARILIVEDDTSDLFLLRRALEAQCAGVQIEVAEDGEKALEFIRAAKQCQCGHPDLILLDLHLPKYDGLEVLRAIRDSAGFRDRRVVVVTNGASPQEKEELRSMSAECRLKPRGLPEFDNLATELLAWGYSRSNSLDTRPPPEPKYGYILVAGHFGRTNGTPP